MSLRSNVQVVVGFEIARVFINARFSFFSAAHLVARFALCHSFRCTFVRLQRENEGEKGAVEAVVNRIRE